MIKTTAKFEANQILIRGKIKGYFLRLNRRNHSLKQNLFRLLEGLIPVDNQLKTATEKDPKLMARMVAQDEL